MSGKRGISAANGELCLRACAFGGSDSKTGSIPRRGSLSCTTSTEKPETKPPVSEKDMQEELQLLIYVLPEKEIFH
jgi:hypothetical protein